MNITSWRQAFGSAACAVFELFVTFFSVFFGTAFADSFDIGPFYATAGGGIGSPLKMKSDLIALATGSGDMLGGKFDQSAVIEFGAGMILPDHFRADLTASNRSQLKLVSQGNDPVTGLTDAARSGNSSNWTVLANGYYDIQTGSDFTPYVGFGVGWATNKLGTVTYSAGGVQTGVESGASHSGFAWRVGLGVAYALTPKLSLDAGYRYLDGGEFRSSGIVSDPYGDVSSGAPVKLTLKSDEIEFLIRYQF